MSWEVKELRISKEVPAGITEVDSYQPLASVHEIAITKFQGAAAFSPNSVTKLIWKWNHATEPEVIIWSIKGEYFIPDEFSITDCNGVRKLAVVLENGEDGPLVMSGYACFKERT
jgi:hypothetical protein